MGFDAPRLAVQVKSFSDPVDITAVHQVQEAMTNVDTDQGFLVSLAGSSVRCWPLRGPTALRSGSGMAMHSWMNCWRATISGRTRGGAAFP